MNYNEALRLLDRSQEAHANTLAELETAKEKIQVLERENLVLKSLDRIARIVRAAENWTPDYRKLLVKALVERFPDTKP